MWIYRSATRHTVHKSCVLPISMVADFGRCRVLAAPTRHCENSTKRTRQRDKSHTSTRQIDMKILSRWRGILSRCRFVAFSVHTKYIYCLFENRFEPKGYLFFTYSSFFYIQIIILQYIHEIFSLC